MANRENGQSAPLLSGVSLPGLWFWGCAFLLAATLLSMFTDDVAYAVNHIGDRLSQYVADFVMTVARLALGPSGALIITTAVLVGVARKSDNAED
jgi:hypothetical protein